METIKLWRSIYVAWLQRKEYYSCKKSSLKCYTAGEPSVVRFPIKIWNQILKTKSHRQFYCGFLLPQSQTYHRNWWVTALYRRRQTKGWISYWNPWRLWSESHTVYQPTDQHKLSWCLRVYRCRRESLPPRGRGTALAVEGACVTLGLDKTYCIALSLSQLRWQLPPGGSLRVRSTLGVWALPEARVASNAVIQRRNWR